MAQQGGSADQVPSRHPRNLPMTVEPDQPAPLPERPACPEGNLAAAQQRICELEHALCDCEQELAAANEIIEEQDWRIEELKLELEGAGMMLNEKEEARQELELRLDEAEDAQAEGTPICSLDELDAGQIIDAVQKGRIPAPLPPEGSQHHGAAPSRRSNPVVDAMVAKFKARDSKK
jgi:hypothetical protein